jgi:uncharacterized delta-60 repeat protein
MRLPLAAAAIAVALPLACSSGRTCIDGLDCGFGFAGYRLAPVFQPARDVVVMPDGGIRAAGSAFVSQYDVSVFAVTAGGDPDGSFGVGGYLGLFRAGDQIVSAMAAQPDGKLVVEATTSTGGNATIELVRLESDGSLDPSFGNGGVAQVDYGPNLGAVTDSAGGLAILPDGKILVSATAVVGSGTDFAVSRFTALGQLDPTFGVAGSVTRSLADGVDDRASELVLGSGGTILVAGNTAFGGAPHAAILAFNADGSVHSTFGGGSGEAVRPELLAVRDLEVAPDGKILLSGAMDDGAGHTDFGIERFGSDGFLDLGFGTAGVGTFEIGTSVDRIEDLAVAADGTILAAGYANDGASILTLARVGGTGTLGEVTKVRGGHAYGIRLDAQGRAIVAGDYAGHMAIVRMKP